MPWSETTIRSIGSCSRESCWRRISHQLVDMRHRSSGLRAVGPVLMPGVIDVGIVKRDQVGTLRRRQAQPGDDLIDALVIGKVIVEIQVIGGPAAINLGLRAGPEEAGAAHALLLRQHPQRRASVPASVALRGRIAVGVKLLARPDRRTCWPRCRGARDKVRSPGCSDWERSATDRKGSFPERRSRPRAANANKCLAPYFLA